MSASPTVLPEQATHQQTRTFNQQLVLRALHDQPALARRPRAADRPDANLGRRPRRQPHRRRPDRGGRPRPIEWRQVAHPAARRPGRPPPDRPRPRRGAVQRRRRQPARRDPALHHLPLEGRNGEAAVELVFQLVDALRADDRSPLLGIGIGAPGVIDTYGHGPLVGQPRLGRAAPRAARRGALRRAGRGRQRQPRRRAGRADVLRRPRPNNLIVIRVGRGIGAGIILNGQLFQGDGYGAGEFGHVFARQRRRAVPLRPEGCLETMTSMRALVDAANASNRRSPTRPAW